MAGEKPALMTATTCQRGPWLLVLRRYMLIVAFGNLAWEFAHMPLYTIWETGTAGEIVFAAFHCTGGDVLIAFSALGAALFLFATDAWPEVGYRGVAVAATATGVAYAIVSEWLNVDVRQFWAYRDLMPVIPVIEVGLSPIAQWIVLPSLAFWWARRTRESQ
jgi:hypothetical protein